MAHQGIWMHPDRQRTRCELVSFSATVPKKCSNKLSSDNYSLLNSKNPFKVLGSITKTFKLHFYIIVWLLSPYHFVFKGLLAAITETQLCKARPHLRRMVVVVQRFLVIESLTFSWSPHFFNLSWWLLRLLEVEPRQIDYWSRWQNMNYESG